ncbi:IS66 family transposase [Sporosarcina jeotgali]|uniref:IS66 family transposase n=1 Tax=Sporosarcina jeotgali TaxID=3020056 RepID=A0ABZ0KX82_9BACL|nr:IS66 family transposase [Sporosarcina sp. B2O-1]WOV83788.1 IS66 family transposase [Sporosarcina sp. B2O-1]WOV83896.1 IS66 family transposase [Sporosarcina sp. B2O-1]WOV84758.1 IS66 family transposase [Sporosarcina sp. B2O-1]WOV85744.1 IS66 family transposase [Sporosarcina sp. B2O-1]
MANRTSEQALEKVISMLEEQLAHSNQQNEQQSKQIEKLTEQVQHLTKMLFGSKSEKSRYNVPDGQSSLFDEEEDPFHDSEQTEDQSQQVISYTVVRKASKKKRNDHFHEGVETEVVHHYPDLLTCSCCQNDLARIGGIVVREEAEFIPAKLKRIQHMEHSYECKHCKLDSSIAANIVRGKAPQPVIQRSLAGPSVLAKVISDKYNLYLPLYRQVKEWLRHGLETNDKNLSNWVIKVSNEWLLPLYQRMTSLAMRRTVLHVDETTAQVIYRPDGKPGNTKAYNWVYKTVPCQGPVMVLFHSSLSRAREVLKNFLGDYKGTIICDGYSAYGGLPGVTFANCWAHVRRYWLKVDSKNGRIGVDYCNQLYRLENKFREMRPGKRRRMRKKYSKPIVTAFFKWIEESHFYGKNAIATATDYTLKRKDELQRFLFDGRIEIDNNPAENAIRPNVLGRKNWLFSVSEAGAQANAICLSLAETAKIHGIDFYAYLKKVLTDLPSLHFQQTSELLDAYFPWSPQIQETCKLR